MDPKTFILILNWNGWEDTVQCLESVVLSTCPVKRIVVIDNGSTDDSVYRIESWAAANIPGRTGYTAQILPLRTHSRGMTQPEESLKGEYQTAPLVIIRTGANLGFAGGNNVGIRYALTKGADYILLLNNDAFFRSPETLSVMVNFMEKTPRAGACGARLFYPDGLPQQSYGNFPSALRTLAFLFPLYKLLPQNWLKNVRRSNIIPEDSVQQPIPIDWPSGACLMIRSKMIEDVGLLDERFFLYVEETDWCFRMRAKSWDRYYLPQAEVIHTFGGSVNNAAESMQHYHLESQITYFRKHFSKPVLLIIIAGYLLRSLFSICYWKVAAMVQSGSVRDKSLSNLNYWLRAADLAFQAMPEFFYGSRSNINPFRFKPERQK